MGNLPTTGVPAKEACLSIERGALRALCAGLLAASLFVGGGGCAREAASVSHPHGELRTKDRAWKIFGDFGRLPQVRGPRGQVGFIAMGGDQQGFFPITEELFAEVEDAFRGDYPGYNKPTGRQSSHRLFRQYAALRIHGKKFIGINFACKRYPAWERGFASFHGGGECFGTYRYDMEAKTGVLRLNKPGCPQGVATWHSVRLAYGDKAKGTTTKYSTILIYADSMDSARQEAEKVGRGRTGDDESMEQRHEQEPFLGVVDVHNTCALSLESGVELRVSEEHVVSEK